MENETLFQYFEWYLPETGNLWKRAQIRAEKLQEMGITAVWLPPAYKGQAGIHDVGYGVYDLYDLGEFDQKGTVPTKYGTKDEYIQCVKALQDAGIRVYVDIVLNHRMGADETEEVEAVEDDPANRLRQTSGPEKIRAWTRFTFPGRHGTYSDFVWDASCFNGVDWDENTKRKSIFLFSGKSWDWGVDSENGNYDYLMGADVDFSNAAVQKELKAWGRWYFDTVGFDGVRLDALKHIGSEFVPGMLADLRNYSGREIFSVGEYWSRDVEHLKHYLSVTDGCTSLFDVPLHFHFRDASVSNGQFPMDHILDGTLLKDDPSHAVTFVDNHDTQPGQALSSWVDGWFKKIAYSLILLYGEGTPCVFWGDLYGIPHDGIQAVYELRILMQIRRRYAYGCRHDYFDDANVVGFTREGDDDHPDSGLAVIVSDGAGGSKHMYIGKSFAGRTFVDSVGGERQPVTVGEDGFADFFVNGGNASVWILQQAAETLFVMGETF